jgi:hypothetical protein
MKEAILSAARADAVPEAVAGLWTVKKFTFATAFDVPREPGKVVTIPAGNYTQLYRMTMDKLHSPYGDLVMQDTPNPPRPLLRDRRLRDRCAGGAGFQTVAFCEADERCRAFLEKTWGEKSTRHPDPRRQAIPRSLSSHRRTTLSAGESSREAGRRRR